MSQEKSFTLIGNFTDNITSKLDNINRSLEGMRRTMQSFSNRNTGFNSVTKSIGKVVGAYKQLSAEQKTIRSEINLTNNAMRQQSTLLNSLAASVGRAVRGYKHLPAEQRNLRSELTRSNNAMRQHYIVLDGLTTKIGRSVGAHKRLSNEQRNLKSRIDQSNSSTRQHSVLLNRVSRSMNSYTSSLDRMSARGGGAQVWDHANRSAQRYQDTLRGLRGLRGSGGGVPPYPRGGGGPPVVVGGGGGYSRGGGGGSKGSVIGEVITGGLVTNAIVAGFYQGAQIIQNAIGSLFGAFAERTKDQLEDIASAGGIFSAAKFGGAKGLPATFQGALEMQDDINKSMASIASALPGTTQDYVMNARRMTDTLGQVMTKDTKNFEKLAEKLSGQIGIQGAKAFEVVNVETAKATTLLEKLNPTRTVVPMTQIVEDMMKSEKVSVGGLRKYVSFRRATTFEAALNRNLEGLNKAGAGTADRLAAIIKTLKEAVPPELITAMTTSVSGVIEGFKSAIFDPDVGIFGLSRTLSMEVVKFNRETGKAMVDKAGRQIMETTNFFKMFGEVFGNIGNLINSAILPGISSLYNPFEHIAEGMKKIREYSYEIFRRQQLYTTYFSNLAEKHGMSTGMFKSMEKGGIGVVMDILDSFNMISKREMKQITAIMEKKVSAKQIEIDMRQIYAKLIPAVMDSPFFTQIGMVIGDILARLVTVIADTMDAVLHREMPSASAFVNSFKEGGGLDALNRIILYLGEILGRVVMEMAKIIGGALLSSVASGNFALAGLMAAPLFMIPGLRKGLFGDKKGPGLLGRLGSKGKAISALSSDANASRLGAPAIEPVRRFSGISTPSFRAMRSQRITHPLFPFVGLGVRPGIGGLTVPGPAPEMPVGQLSRARRAAEISQLMGGASEIPEVAKAGRFTQFMEGTFGKYGKYGRFMEGSRAKLLSSKAGPLAESLGLHNLLKAGPGLKALKEPMKLMKTSGNLGPLAIGTSIITAITSLLSGESLANSLGKGAGPLIGSAIGFALLGPLGSFIGGWIGSMEEITQPLGDAFQAIFNSLQTTFEILGQVFGDIIGLFNMLVRAIPGVSKGFNILRFAMFALLSPFKLLEIGINGIYDLYLWIKSKTVGLSKEEQDRLNERRTQRATDEFTIQGREAAGYSLAVQKAEEYKKFLAAKSKGDTAAMNRIAEYMRSIDRLREQRGEIPAQTGAPKPPSPEQAETTRATTEAARVQLQAANTQATAASKALTAAGVTPPSGGMAGATDPNKLRAVIDMLGYKSDARATAYLNAATNLKNTSSLLADVKAKLDAKIDAALASGMNLSQVMQLPDIVKLGREYSILQTKTAAASAAMDKAYKAMPQTMANAINTNMAKLPLSKIEQAIADRIKQAQIQTQIQTQVAFSQSPFGTPGTGQFTPPGSPFTLPNNQGTVFRFPNNPLGLPQTQTGPFFTQYNGHLGDAISTEMRHMPAGAKLAIANSSETIIPAAEGNAGFGMSNFVAHMATMARNTGASNMILNILRNSVSQLLSSIGEVAQNTAESISTMKSGAMRVKFMIGGTGGTGGPGAVDAFNPIASSYGLQITSGYRPGDPGYHGIDRARDYSNSTGPTPQMHEFATFMAAAFGGDLAELIYTPLGFSIKNGQVVPPYAQAAHYNHVHVAYALGAKNPALFSSEERAAAWEETMSPKYASIRTVTANSSEGFGGGNTINAPISIYQQPGQDPEELASIVLTRLSLAVESLSTKLG